MNPVLFGTRERQLFGVHTPAMGARKRHGVVICPPWGLEYERAHRACRQLGERLAARGYDVFRFDYYGTGDSGGGASDVTFDGCVSDAITAVDELCALAGVRRVTLIGLRLGAAVAAHAAARTRAAARLVLWDPISDGRAHIQEVNGAARVAPDGRWVGGHLLTRDFQKEIEALTPAALATAAQPTLVIASAERTDHEELVRALEATGEPVERIVLPNPPTWVEQAALGVGAIPVDILDHIADWEGRSR